MLAKVFALRHHQGFLKYLKNTSWMMAEQLLRIIAGLLVGIWVARYLGPEQFGIFSYAIAFTAIFGAVAKLGLDSVVVRELVSRPQMRDIYLGTSFWLKLIGATLIIGLIFIALLFDEKNRSVNTYIAIISASLFFQSFEVVDFYFQSKVLAKAISICKAFQLTISSILKIYLILNEKEIIWFVWVAFFDAFILSFSYMVAYWVNNKVLFFNFFNLSVAKKLIIDSWPLIFSTVFIAMNLKLDQVIIQNILGNYSVGVYTAAVNLILPTFILPSLICTSLFPAIISSKKISVFLYLERMSRLYSLLIYMSFFVSIPIFLMSDYIIDFLYGAQYDQSSSILSIYSFSIIFAFIGAASNRYLVVENASKIILIKSAIGVALNVIINLIFVPMYGVDVAAYSTVISFAFVFYFYFVFDKRFYRHFIFLSKSLYYPFLPFLKVGK